MKHFAYALVLLLSAISMNGFSQSQHPGKPTLFANSPAKITCQETDFNSIFEAKEGQQVTLNLPNNFSLSGTVTANVLKYNNTLQTVIVILPSLDDAILSISKRIDADRNSAYVGRIINQKYFDGYELTKNAAGGSYQFTKIETDRVIQPCNQQ